MRASPQELKIISALQLDADLPLSELCKKTGLRAHTVHYHLRRLKEAGIIRRGALINLPALGFEQYAVYFSLAPTDPKNKQRLLAELKKHPRVFWFAELGGDFQYGMSVIAKRPDEALEFLSALSAKGDGQIMRKAVSLIVNLSIFRKKYLSPTLPVSDLDMLTIPRGETKTNLDQKDMQVLSLLAEGQGESVQAMAKLLGAPRTSLEYRIKKLKEDKILLRSIYYVNAGKMGYQTFKLLVYARGLSAKFEKDFFSFARLQPQVVFFVSNFGSWDFELTVEADSPKMAVAVTESIYEKFSTNVQEIRILPVFEQTTSSGFLKL